MVNFFSRFVVPEPALREKLVREELRKTHPDPADLDRAFAEWSAAHPQRGTVGDVVDHIDHIAKVAGIDHVGIGSDFDGITSTPVGLEDVSCYPRLTEELLRRGYSEADVHKVLGGNVLRAFREAGKVAERLRETTAPDTGPSPEEQGQAGSAK